jgi:hypothetical protein
VACSSCYIPFPLDASYFILSTSSSSYSSSCVGFFSSSTCIVVGSYSSVCIYSTSTIVGISCVLVCDTQLLLHMFHPSLLDTPTLSGDMLMKYGLQTSKLPGVITNSHSLTLSLSSVFYSLENNTLSFFPPFF